MKPLERRELALLALGGLAGTIGWIAHRSGLYTLNPNVDSILHLLVGFGVGGLVYGAIAFTGMPQSRRRSAFVLGSMLVAGVVWEIYESLPRPWGYGYVNEWFHLTYLNDTTADLALVMIGGFLVVWLGTNYRGDPGDDTTR